MSDVKITVPSDMSDELFAEIVSGLRWRFGVDSVPERINDDKVLGGFIADIDGDIYDLSIASQLKKMSRHINA